MKSSSKTERLCQIFSYICALNVAKDPNQFNLDKTKNRFTDLDKIWQRFVRLSCRQALNLFDENFFLKNNCLKTSSKQIYEAKFLHICSAVSFYSSVNFEPLVFECFLESVVDYPNASKEKITVAVTTRQVESG